MIAKKTTIHKRSNEVGKLIIVVNEQICGTYVYETATKK